MPDPNEVKPNQGDEVKVEAPVEQPQPTPPAPVKEEKPSPAPQPAPVEQKQDAFVEIDGQKLSLDELKAGYMRQSDYTKKTQELSEFKKKVEAVTEVLSPRPVSSPVEEPQKFLTQEELDTYLADRDRRREQEIALKTEIETLAKEYNGENGLPKYDDATVFTWQQQNGKVYLSPKEAFEQMYKDQLIDFEVKKRLQSAGKSAYQETPGGGSEIRVPEEKKVFLDEKGREDANARKNAILETWGNAEQQ